MHIVIYSPSQAIWGGGQIYIEQLCSYLNSRGHRALVATSEPHTFAVPTMAMPSVVSRWARAIHAVGLARQLRASGVEAVLLNDLSSLWLAPLFRLAGIRTFALLHLYLQLRDSSGLGHTRGELAMLRFAARFCHRVFSVNRQNAAAFPVPVTFVGNFVPDWFFNEPVESGPGTDLLMVCRLSKQKDVPLALRILHRLNALRPTPLRLLIVGDGEERGRIEALIRELDLGGVVRLEPWVARRDLPAVFDSASCFLMTSHHEGFATTLIEAHARGLPALVTRGSGYGQEFVESGERPTGIAFSPEEVEDEAWIARIASWLANCGELRGACIAKARKFNADRVLGAIEAGMKEPASCAQEPR